MVTASVTIYGEPNGTFIGKYFRVTNMSAVSDNVNSTNIIGIVKNIGNKTLNGAGVVVELYDFNNRLINVIEYTPVIVKTLGPNQVSPFKVWTNTRSFDHYVVRIVGAIG
ncbi:MAG: FxLYD domain-containing protein [Nitrososphaeraceae archaeon]